MASNSNRDDPLSFTNPSSSPIPVSDGDGYLADPNSQLGSTSGSYQNDGLLAGDGGSGSNSDVEFGFLRQEMRQSPLVGTVQMYDRHVFLCYKNPQVWPPRVEAAEFDRLPRLLSAALMARKAEMKKRTLLTICEGHDGSETSNGDVLIFPDTIRYRRLTHFDVDTFVEEVLVKDAEWLPGTPEMLMGWSYVFVCSHASRDRRCGVCGPAVVKKFKEEIDVHGFQGQVSVSPCSHIGGHKYAGNVIIFGPNSEGKVTGHWYGYVTPDDVPVLLEQHIGKGEIVDRLWRGQMGLSEEDQRKTQDHRLQLNGDAGTEKISKAMEISSTGNGTDVDLLGCCQGSGTTTCCQSSSPEEKIEKEHANEEDAKVVEKKSNKENKISNKGVCTRKACAMPTWFESWEREDTYAALAVVAAAVSVAVAYHCYRQLR
eukprot:TRINITY_DN19374_c0_g1_i1.p1 TRINITY_DN19374_c0_g1~~TRINITY_DN19374_c0_g1_i1.p1  ORF type:complete len:428 (+),score=64.06 TRINITY_DN19374_c0_g1_i1:139-1422(+)